MNDIRNILETMQEIRVGDMVEILVQRSKMELGRVRAIDHAQDYPYEVRHLNGTVESLTREEIRPFSMHDAEGQGRR